MIGTIRINFIVGLVAFFFNFIFSLGHNVLVTVFIRSIIAFILFFAFSYLIRFIWFMIVNESEKKKSDSEIDRGIKGTSIDYVTPNDDVKMGSSEDEFVPLLTSVKKPNPSMEFDPSEIAKAIRNVFNDK